MKIGLKERRRLAGLIQADVAKHLGLSISQYSRYEADPTSLTGDKIAILARLFACSQEDIIGTVDPQKGSSVIASVRRTVPVYALNIGWGDDMQEAVGEYAPTGEVSVDAYAVEQTDDTMSHEGQKSIWRGDWAVVEPTIEPQSGNIVHYVDPKTGESLLRIFQPLHPTNPRAPGFMLRCADPNVDDIYVPQRQASKAIRGVVTERRTLLR
ncbi:helix-turn-helix transcriptional regulator [uncultured Hyphomicrobium sp.]|uniref:helix-turn-helix domain-containing protein n=1 Tax=uncultured Hyphomicrobium sp. TaxID=194373 RepID=UPI0025EF1709|nr:helix-turn-helix transcriptional regulator [uncultured Hyphomicrobium sp.]